MKKQIGLAVGMWLTVVVVSFGQVQPGLTAEKRAQHLSEKMISDLRLNNFQARRLKAVNLDLANKMMALEAKYPDNAVQLEENLREVFRQRDLELEKFLSTDQYSKYYGSRGAFTKFDKDFATQGKVEELNVKSDPAGKGLDLDKAAAEKGKRAAQ